MLTSFSMKLMRWAVCAALLLGFAVPSAFAAPLPIDGKLYQIRQVGTSSQTYRLYRLSTPYEADALGSATPGGIVLNALAFKTNFAGGIPVNGTMFALRLSSPFNLYEIDDTGPIPRGVVSGLPGASYNSGAIDAAGNYYVSTLSTSTIYRINISDPNNPVATAVPLSAPINTGDFAISPVDGRLYAISATVAPAVLTVIDITSPLATKPVQTFALTGNTANTFGTVFFDTTDTLYAYENGGQFYRVPKTGGAVTLLSGADTTAQSDGASSPFSANVIAVTKTAGPIVPVNAQTYDVTFDVTVSNPGTVTDTNVQVSEDLTRAFVSGNPTLTIQSAPAIVAGVALAPNPGFDGTSAAGKNLLIGTDSLAAGAQSTIRFTVRATYPTPGVVPTSQSNTVYASSISPPAPPRPNAPNPGFTFPPGQTPVPPPDVVATDQSPPITFVLPRAITGRVFEDVNYGGGAGRPITTAGASGVDGVRVELYNPDGTFNSFTTTATVGGNAGSYAFAVPIATGYTVRVVNSTVLSTRAGSVTALRGVQTFRVNNGVADPDRVGGQVPALVDGASGAAGTSISATGVLSTGGQAQSISDVDVPAGGTTGIDFGFNFDTIVNTNTSGQGSLAQFILNSNALANGGLAQTGQTGGNEVSIFMISNGGAQAGFSGQPNLLTGGVAVINVTTALPAITGINANDTVVSGATQTTFVGNTNTAVLGVGGTVGVGALALSTVAGPEVQIQDGGGFPVGLDVQASNVEIRRVAVLGFGTTPNSNTSANIRVGSVAAVSGTIINGNVIGTTATSFSLPALANGGDNIRSIGATGGTVFNNLVGFAPGKGVALEDGSNAWTVQNNEVRGNAIGNDNLDGIDVERSRDATVVGNLSINNLGVGMDSFQSTGGNTFTNNTATGNGRGTNETPGARIYGTGNVLSLNILSGNYGAGAMIENGATAVISRNSIFDNGEVTALGGGAPSGQIGIDLLDAGDDAGNGGAPYVSPNDVGDGDTGGNALFNFPVFQSAQLDGGTLRLRGWARPGSVIELFIANPDPSGFGEGQTFLVTLTEGVADADATVSAYSDPQAGSDNTNRFDFSIPVPGGVALGTVLTATATLAGQTSEFSENVIVAAPVIGGEIAGRVYLDVNANATFENGDTPTGLANLFIKIFGPTGNAVAVVPVDATTGLYSAPNLPDGTYSAVLSTSNDPADRTPILPAGYVGTEAPGGVRSNIVVANGTPLDDQNFGLFNGSRVVGRVFNDNGAGAAGTANDGIINGNEVGITGVAVRATNGAGTTTFSTAVTGADGFYTLFIPASAGAAPVRIVETNKASFISTGATVGNSGGTYNRAADAILFTNAPGTTYSNLNFGDVPPSTFVAPGTQTVTPGNIALYPHTFTAGTEGSVSFSTTNTPQPNVPGWQQTIFRDLNGNGVVDTGEPIIGGTGIASVPIPVTGGGVVSIIVQDFAPATLTNGAKNTILVSATLDPTGTTIPNEVLTLTDVTNVGTATELQLTKTVDKTTALPGEVLIYTITYLNTGSQPISNLVISDTTPAFTGFLSAAYGTTPAGLTPGTLTVPAGASRNIRWTFGGALAPGATGTVTFRVRVNQ